MFKKTRAKLQASFNLFLKTFSDLSASIREQTETNRTIEASANLRHEQLLVAIGEVSKSAKYLALSESKRNLREGRTIA